MQGGPRSPRGVGQCWGLDRKFFALFWFSFSVFVIAIRLNLALFSFRNRRKDSLEINFTTSSSWFGEMFGPRPSAARIVGPREGMGMKSVLSNRHRKNP